MIELSFAMLVLTALFYLAAFAFHLISFLDINGETHRPAFALMRLGFLLNTFYFAAEAVHHHFFLPVSNLSEAMAFLAWSIAFVYLVLLVKAQSDSFGLILTPVLFTLIAVSCWSYFLKENSVQLPDNPFFAVHIAGAFFAYANFAISFTAGILFLIQHHELKAKKAGTFYHKLPSLEELEKLIYQPMLWGVSLLIGAIILGLFWSRVAFGHMLLWDIKTMAAVATVVAYSLILFFRFKSVLRTKTGAVLALAAFGLVLVSFIGTRFIEGSHHYIR